MMLRPDAILLLAIALAGCAREDATPPAVGTLERDRIEVTADSTEPVLAFHVCEGDRVAAGTLLLEQDDRRARAAFERVRAEVAAASAALAEAHHGPRTEELERVRARIDAVRSEVEVAKLELTRTRELAERDFASTSEVDLLRGRVDQAIARRVELERLLAELEAGTRSEVVQRLGEQVRAAEQQLVVAELALERTRPVAPVDGIVEAIPIERGERPATGRPLVVLLDAERVYARIHLPAPLRARLAVGDPARIHIRGQDGERTGVLRWVSGEAAFTPFYALTQRDASRLSYLAEVDVEDGDRLPVGVPVEVRFPGLDTEPGERLRAPR